MSTLQERVKEYLRQQDSAREAEHAEDEYREFMRRKEEADLQIAQEHLEKLRQHR